MFDFTQTQFLGLSLHSTIMLIMYFIVGIYAIFSAIFYYHWQTYATDTKVTTYTLILYFVTTIPLLIIMTILAITIT